MDDRLSESEGRIEFLSSHSDVESDGEVVATRPGKLKRSNNTEKV